MDSLQIIQNAANKGGFKREVFVDQRIPTSISNVCVLPFFGDLRSMALASMLLFKRYREEVKGSKYFIVCSYPGCSGLFPYADEFWSVNPSVAQALYSHADGLKNVSNLAVEAERNLNYFFEDVVNIEKEISIYYNHGLTQVFLDKFKHIKCFKPTLASSIILGNSFNRELLKRFNPKIFICPVKYVYGCKDAKVNKTTIRLEFWVELVKHLLSTGFDVVVYQNFISHNISAGLEPEINNQVIYVADGDIMSMLVAMHSCDCVLDIFSGISRLAMIARVPFLSCDDRNFYNLVKDYELDYLCGDDLPRERFYSFCNIITSGQVEIWRTSLFDIVSRRLHILLKDIDKDKLPSSSETDAIVQYAKVKKAQAKKLGVRFVKVERI